MDLLPVTKHLDRTQRLHDLAVALGATCQCQQSENAVKASAMLERSNPNHYGPGERGGQFAPKDEGGSGSSSTSAAPKPVQVASNDAGVMAGSSAQTPEQVAAGGDSDETGGRNREAIEDDFFDPAAPVRQGLYNAASAKLRAIDPSNQALQSLHGPDWVPSKEDVNNLEDALNRAIEENAARAAVHAYDKHVTVRGEFPEIRSPAELQALAQDVMRRSPAESAPRGRVLFYQSSTNTLVIVNTNNPTQSSVYRPERGRAYVDDLLEDK